MKFGINLFPTVNPEELAADDYFAGALDLAVLADQLGFHHVKTVEHYFYDYGGYSPDPVTFLAAVAARTSNVRVVTGAVLPAFTHPLKLAGKLAMLDNISRGRLDIGFGRAFLPGEFAAFEIPMDESQARFDEGVAATVALLGEEHVKWAGDFHNFGPVTMLPRPVQTPHPRVLVATAKTRASAENAARRGFGVMLVPSINSRSDVTATLDLYRQTAAAAGHTVTQEDVHMSYNAYIAEDPIEAFTRGEAYSRRAGRALKEATADWATTSSSNYVGYEKLARRAEERDFQQQISDNKALVGTPSQVLHQLEEIRDWYGDITVSLQAISGAVPFEEARRTVALFAEHVLPHFR
ncbi:LLM class flavin-dependent oxidoreductase [Rhodococcoides kyotonense]|uniref:Flavin-dependent oxidoreductase, luciferase family (Includes alkanesulfonate monooxygenase SsuD and methylene tetrahydromethanopterin reductase) n=1 Tax=Rhodococcoides kyotonense TaxID=398843 RepID=A0A239M9Q8_9NOCA|nr:LLM class flavin-dependent oxidoreductase [Rhodococcus kyotonensis]SNT39697.1 Flavin-dependent oxidoreductase, luciferase family (includes alkanesulfonate monooxygenase SsuD and methylene tetrahydromethanopterin reductase) [Rhodococcus kyotonensis]